MTHRSWRIGLGVWLAVTPLTALALPPDPLACRPAAISTADNDIRLTGDKRPSGMPVEMPAPVRDQLRVAALRLLSRVGPDLVDGRRCADLFHPVYRVSGFGRRDLFVSEIDIGNGGSFFYLVLHDLVSGAATEDPPWVGAKWPQIFGAGDPLVTRPFVSSADLFLNGHRQIVFEERVHNGTMYNGVIYHYFDIGPQLELTRVLARETRMAALDQKDGLYVRELTQLSPTRLRLDTFSVGGNRAARRQALGFVILESPGPGIAFRVVERHPVGVGAQVGLVSFGQAPEDEDRFLREGYRFYY